MIILVKLVLLMYAFSIMYAMLNQLPRFRSYDAINGCVKELERKLQNLADRTGWSQEEFDTVFHCVFITCEILYGISAIGLFILAVLI